MTTDLAIPTLYIDRDVAGEWLTGVQVGAVIDDGMPADRFRPLNDHVAWVLDAARERTIGFKVRETADFDPAADDCAELWNPDGPRFDAPLLALVNALAGEIIVAALAAYPTKSTLNRVFYIQALGAEDAQSARLWQLCLECGDLAAHYGLGYTYYDLGRHADAYKHLKYYAQIVSEDPWVWTWLGRAALATGKRAEAIDAWRRACDLDERDEAGARELLDALLRTAPR